MQLRTYTGLWKVEKRLYKFYDIALPYPVSIKQVGVFIAAVIPWFMLMSLFRVPLGTPIGFLVWVAPPIAVAWYSNRPIAEGKGLWDYGLSQVRYFFGPKSYAALTPIPPKPQARHLRGEVWRSDSSRPARS